MEPEVIKNCPICEWQGASWQQVECKPNTFIQKKCPACGSYPRDRLVWILLKNQAKHVKPKKLRVIEIGASIWSYHWKRKLYFYRNADLPSALSPVDLPIIEGRIAHAPANFDVAVISYVLSMIEDESIRLSLLQQLNDRTALNGLLILFDDILLDKEEHAVVEHDEYFHKLRLGRPLLNEIRRAAWQPSVVKWLPDDGTLATTELPFILAKKALK